MLPSTFMHPMELFWEYLQDRFQWVLASKHGPSIRNHLEKMCCPCHTAMLM
jgi:hypothetical protein